MAKWAEKLGIDYYFMTNHYSQILPHLTSVTEARRDEMSWPHAMLGAIHPACGPLSLPLASAEGSVRMRGGVLARRLPPRNNASRLSS
jgi:hypothetical protein